MNRNESKIMDPNDLEFVLYDWLQVDELSSLPRYAEHSRETFDEVLDLTRKIAEEYFQPHSRASDLDEPHVVNGSVQIVPGVKTALDAFAHAGLIGATMDEEVGGFQLPQVVYRAASMWLQAANIGTSAYPLLTTAAANLIRAYAAPELVERYLAPMADGRWFGTMNLSEPGVGSSLGDLDTVAQRQADGTYRLRGEKMWISGGDHELSENIVHLVLARTGGAGTRGLSLLIVPKWLGQPGSLTQRNDIALVGLNHKMGFRGTVNTALSYGSGAYPVEGGPGAVGYLIGEEGHGLTYMFHMMNEARLAVGASAAALGVTGFLHAREYAKHRVQGRDLAAKDPSLPPVPIIRHPDVRRMLLESKAYAEGSVALVLYTTRLLDLAQAGVDSAGRRNADLLVDVLTPIAKSWPSQWGVEADDLAIQIHGGSGYVRDFPVEQFYRDNRLNDIHEGTHGIHALDLLGRKVRLADGAGFALLVDAMLDTARRAEAQGSDLAPLLASRVARLEDITRALWADGDAVSALANASEYLDAAGDLVVAWLLLDQLLAVQGRTDQFAEGKRLTTRFFFVHVLPRADAQLDLLASGDRMLADLDESLI
ncbi:MAG: acyl-CoA dehydrogenase [Actinomycetales bacterium]|jgi:butyryl-CoA dehydrogenase